MKIEIKLEEKEALNIIINHFQPIFPDKVISGEIKSYGGVNLEVTEKNSKTESEENIGE